MGIILDRNIRAIVQGITGTQGAFHTRLMLEYGTRIVAGVTPGRGGSQVETVPVYDLVSEALAEHSADASIVLVPAPSAPDAVMEALEAGIETIIVITEGIPVQDSVEFLARARNHGARIIGPNCPGVITVGECKLGIMPAQIFSKGAVGVVSRSGTLTYEVAAELSRSGLGVSTCVGIGGDPVIGLDFIEALHLFDDDPATHAVALIGEIGGDMEERTANFIRDSSYEKQVVAFVAGRSAISGKRMGHAGAIIQGTGGTAESKISAFRAAGVAVADTPREVANKVVL